MIPNLSTIELFKVSTSERCRKQIAFTLSELSQSSSILVGLAQYDHPMPIENASKAMMRLGHGKYMQSDAKWRKILCLRWFKGVNLTTYSKMRAYVYGVDALQSNGTSLGGLSCELLLPKGLLMDIEAICYGMYMVYLFSIVLPKHEEPTTQRNAPFLAQRLCISKI